MTLRDKQRLVTQKLTETRKMIQSNLRDLVDKVSSGMNVEGQIKALQANIDKAIKLTLLGLNVATRDQIDFLDKKIDIVNAKADKLAAERAHTHHPPKKEKKEKKEKKKKKASAK